LPTSSGSSGARASRSRSWSRTTGSFAARSRAATFRATPIRAPALRYARPATPIAPSERAAAAFEQIALHPDRRMVVLDDDGETLIGLLCLNTRKTDFCGTPS
jgi:hypothetical protein